MRYRQRIINVPKALDDRLEYAYQHQLVVDADQPRPAMEDFLIGLWLHALETVQTPSVPGA